MVSLFFMLLFNVTNTITSTVYYLTKGYVLWSMKLFSLLYKMGFSFLNLVVPLLSCYTSYLYTKNITVVLYKIGAHFYFHIMFHCEKIWTSLDFRLGILNHDYIYFTRKIRRRQVIICTLNNLVFIECVFIENTDDAFPDLSIYCMFFLLYHIV